MIPEWLFAGTFAAGMVFALALVWRRLSLAEHLEDELRELSNAGYNIQIAPDALELYRSRTYVECTGNVRSHVDFNRRLAAARELLERIERTRRR